MYECDEEVFKKGRGLCICTGPSVSIEAWVQELAKRAEARIDWHFSGGRANVLYLGDDEGYKKALVLVKELEPGLRKLGSQLLSMGQPALFRAGVDDEPEGAIAYDPHLRAFMTEEKKSPT